MRAIWAFNFIETARPALSSAGEVIFEPDDRRWRDWLRFAEDCISSEAAFCADRFVLMTITNSFRESPREGHLICATSMSRVFQFKGETPFSPPALSGCRSGVVFNIAGAWKFFTRPAQPSCPSRCVRSFCPPFGVFRLADPGFYSGTARVARTVLMRSSN
jgi:hypothetical protein